ncbi:DHA2 family lincomycin resistance protein-like MFS transporter [Halopolyspora algeriensis]|uniref:DHA2 family lincomycin resistance protein-like MFS transporter n=1 Tax=Halopolyspora algeriensis TaxID=1500506 RepID=A0A368VHS8_9ACTN|nr:MDR family MFS transporter [Halopolyspora algeriensis]RCW40948.1 DHA2 family lincomycin resistance protein-like MFS transporter [Halopolyspora algeriensis]TQM53968.1 DHA2 family lincomycin resistance protein-like MFS transporter [Halopolyspora algeriensis]
MPESSVPAATRPDSAVGTTRPGLVIGVLVLSAFIMILNETILSVALPHLIGALGVAATTVQWLTSGFLLTMAVVIPTTGYLLQRIPPRQVFLAAMTLFSVGTLVCALAPGFVVLLLGRVVQAAGTAVMVPLLMTTVMTLIPEQRRGAMMGNISLVIAVAPAIGPMIGGLVLARLDWRWMFWSVLPLAVALLAVGFVLMRLEAETSSAALDVASVLLSAVAFAGIVYGFSAIGAAAQGGGSMPPWIPILVGVAALVVFVARQLRLQRADRALLDLRPFTHRQFVVAVVLSGLIFMCLLGAGAILLPLYLQSVLGVGPRTTGLAVLPGGLVLGLLGRPVGRLFDRFGARPLVVPGAVGMAISLWLFAALGSGASLAVVIAVHMLLMAALGLMMTPLLTEALAVLPNALYSHGSAIMTTLQQVAGAAGTAAFVAVSALASTGPSGAPDATGIRAAFVVAGVIGLLAVVTALFVRGKRPEAPGHGGDAEIGGGETSTSLAGHR